MQRGKGKIDMFHHFWRWIRHKAIGDWAPVLNVSTEVLNDMISFIEQKNKTVLSQSKVDEMLQNMKFDETCMSES